MRFHVLQVAHVDPVLVNPLDRQHLAFLAWRPEAFSFTVRGGREIADDAADRIAIRHGVGQSLQNQRYVALGGDQAIRVRVERPGLARRQRLRGGKQHEAMLLQARRAAHHRHIDRAESQRLHAERHGLQRRSAGGIEGHRGPRQAKGPRDGMRRDVRAQTGSRKIGSPPILPTHFADDIVHQSIEFAGGQPAWALAKGGKFAEIAGCLLDQGREDPVRGMTGAARTAEIDPGLAAAQLEWIEPRVSQSPRRHVANREKRGVGMLERRTRQSQFLDANRLVGDDPAHRRVGLADRSLRGREVQFAIQPVGWEFAKRRLSVFQEPPIGLGIGRAWQAAIETHDRDRSKPRHIRNL